MNCNILLFLGAAFLGSGLYFGLAKSGDSLLLLILLGGSIAAFSSVVVVLLRSHALRNAAPKKSEPESTPKTLMGIASELDVQAGTTSEINASGNINAKLKVSAEPVLEAAKVSDSIPKFLPKFVAKVEPLHEPGTNKASEIHHDVDSSNKAGVALLMSTPLGDLLLSALLNDPESAGHFVTQAILQAQASSSIRPE